MDTAEPPVRDHLPERPETRLATLTVEIASVADAEAIICATEDGSLPRRILEAAPERRVVAATPHEATHRELERHGIEVVRLPARVADRYRQARLAIGVVYAEGSIAEGDVIACTVGHATSLGGGDLVLVTDVEEASAAFVVSDLVRLTDGIRPRVLSRVLEVAGRIGQVARRGKRVGALFVLGDSDRVLERSRQLVMNPFRGHRQDERMATDPDIDDTLVELAKLDGAFIVRGDGLIRTAGAYLVADETGVEVPSGLGARHVAAAAITARTDATAVVVSETDGEVRVFADGELVLQMDPEFPVL